MAYLPATLERHAAAARRCGSMQEQNNGPLADPASGT
jgi:hypothetical protein